MSQYELVRQGLTATVQVELDGEWLDVPPKSGCLIINVGDLLHRRAPCLRQLGNLRCCSIVALHARKMHFVLWLHQLLIDSAYSTPQTMHGWA